MIEKISILKKGIGIENEKYAKKYGHKLKMKLNDHRTTHRCPVRLLSDDKGSCILKNSCNNTVNEEDLLD